MGESLHILCVAISLVYTHSSLPNGGVNYSTRNTESLKNKQKNSTAYSLSNRMLCLALHRLRNNKSTNRKTHLEASSPSGPRQSHSQLDRGADAFQDC